MPSNREVLEARLDEAKQWEHTAGPCDGYPDVTACPYCQRISDLEAQLAALPAEPETTTLEQQRSGRQRD